MGLSNNGVVEQRSRQIRNRSSCIKSRLTCRLSSTFLVLLPHPHSIDSTTLPSYSTLSTMSSSSTPAAGHYAFAIKMLRWCHEHIPTVSDQANLAENARKWGMEFADLLVSRSAFPIVVLNTNIFPFLERGHGMRRMDARQRDASFHSRCQWSARPLAKRVVAGLGSASHSDASHSSSRSAMTGGGGCGKGPRGGPTGYRGGSA